MCHASAFVGWSPIPSCTLVCRPAFKQLFSRRNQVRLARSSHRSILISKACMNSEMFWRPEGLLREAVELKRLEVQTLEDIIQSRPDHPINLRLAFYESGDQKSRFIDAVKRKDGTIAVIGMLKRFQPRPEGGKPELIAKLDNIGREARLLEIAGVDAVMVNTDTVHYGCELAEIKKISKEVARTTEDRGLPVIRHDLIIHPVQIAEAAAAGACAVNIVAAAALTDLVDLLNAATSMGIDAIVECHTELEKQVAMDCGATLLYLSNRDRTTNKLYPGRAEALRHEIPSWIVTLGGGGIVTASEAWTLLDCGFDAAVIGEALLQSPRLRSYMQEIRSQKRRENLFEMDLE